MHLSETVEPVVDAISRVLVGLKGAFAESSSEERPGGIRRDDASDLELDWGALFIIDIKLSCNVRITSCG